MPEKTGAAELNEPLKTKDEQKSHPIALVVALIGAIFFSSVVSMFSSAFVPYTPQNVTLWLLLNQFFGFPFSTTCIVWVAARSGGVRWTTWVVPLIPLVLIAIANRSYYSPISTSLISYVCLEFLFRLTSLHLRPDRYVSSPKQLTVSALFGLTIAVAIGMSLDLVLKPLSVTPPIQSNNAKMITAAAFGIYYVSTGLVWFSTAWLCVANNQSRYIAHIGLGIHLAIDFIQIAVLLPFAYDEPTLTSFYSPFFIIGTMVVDVLHIGLVFACVATMQAAGYRWEIRRRYFSDERSFPSRESGDGEGLRGVPG